MKWLQLTKQCLADLSKDMSATNPCEIKSPSLSNKKLKKIKKRIASYRNGLIDCNQKRLSNPCRRSLKRHSLARWRWKRGRGKRYIVMLISGSSSGYSGRKPLWSTVGMWRVGRGVIGGWDWYGCFSSSLSCLLIISRLGLSNFAKIGFSGVLLPWLMALRGRWRKWFRGLL